MKYYLGIDGGGTRTTVAVSDECGNILFKEFGKTINFYSVGMEKASQNLKDIICKVSDKLDTDIFEGVFIGCSALDNEADAQTLNALCGGIKAKKIAMNSDLYIALKSVDAKICPCVAICGTGSMAAGEDENGNVVISGGWGHIIGDEGSGYAIAVSALKKCCELCDQGMSSPLLEKANEYFKVDDFRKSIDIIYSPETTKDVIAGFAADVGSICDIDNNAHEIIITEAHSFAKTVLILLRKVNKCSTLGLYGGLFEHNQLFKDTLIADILAEFPYVQPQLLNTPPEESALKLARNL